MHHRPVNRLLAGLAIAGLVACSNAQFYQPYIENVPALDRSVTVQGQFCSDPTDDVERPIKIIIAMDTSLSMTVSDPMGQRAQAMVNLINSFPSNDPDIYVGVLLFAGFTPVWLTNGGLAGFSQVESMSQADIANLWISFWPTPIPTEIRTVAARTSSSRWTPSTPPSRRTSRSSRTRRSPTTAVSMSR